MKMLFSFLVVLFTLSLPLSAQNNYMVFLKQKGHSGSFTPGSVLWDLAVSSLSTRSIERRIKHLGTGNEVSPEDIPVSSEYLAKLEATGARLRWVLKWFDCVSVTADNQTIEKIKQLDFVAHVRPVIRIRIPYEFNTTPLPIEEDLLANASSFIPHTSNFILNTPHSTLYTNSDKDQKLYGGSFIQYKISDVPQVNRMGGKGKGIRIGVLDSGFDWQKHDALKTRKVIAEYDFVKKDKITANQDGDPFSQHNHGTFCFSVCGGYLEGKLVGPSHEAEFVLAKTETTEFERMVEEDNYAAAIMFMDSIGVDITTSSLGYTVFDDTTYRYEDLTGETAICTKAINYAFEKGILTFTAAGNSANEPWYYVSTPGDGTYALAIGAVTRNREIADFSSGGPTADGRIKPDFSAAGVSVFGALASSKNKFERSNGTSAATPIAAGIAGQMLSLFPHLKNTQARFILRYTSDQRMLPDNLYGYGLVSSLEAVTHPNIEVVTQGKLKVHKRFKDEVRAKSVYLVFKTGYKTTERVKMEKIDDDYYTVTLPDAAGKEVFEFSFDAGETENGVNFPSTGRKYYILPGNLNVFIVTPTALTLDQFAKERIAKYTGVNPRIFTKFKSGARSTVIVVRDISGRTVVTIPVTDQFYDNRIIWDGRDANQKRVPMGVYTSTVYIDGRPGAKQIFLRK
ncbi:MAG: hypothetical protein HBSAPP04_16050 [Ignavibacteriaceae bacterium]|nr:MAG: hypothetical protein HBSAPP04_16050 [Ignavibacteriaceae bacterium]